MNNIWFYTFSTSAQVIAAIAGLFTIFVVYKIQHYLLNIEDTKGGIFKIFHRCSSNKHYKITPVLEPEDVFFWKDKKILKKFEEIIEKHKNIDKKDQSPIETNFASNISGIEYKLDLKTLNFYRGLVKQKKEILIDLFLVLTLSFSSILYSIYCLSYPDVFAFYFAILSNFFLLFISLAFITYKTLQIIDR